MVRRRRPLTEGRSLVFTSTRRTISRQVPTPSTSWVPSATWAFLIPAALRHTDFGMEAISSQMRVVRLAQIQKGDPLLSARRHDPGRVEARVRPQAHRPRPFGQQGDGPAQYPRGGSDGVVVGGEEIAGEEPAALGPGDGERLVAPHHPG